MILRRWDPAGRWAAVAALASLVLAVAIYVWAESARRPTVPTPRPPLAGRLPPDLFARHQTDSTAGRLTEGAPFQPDRRPPAHRYVLPELRQDTEDHGPRPPLPAPPVLTGTARGEPGPSLVAFRSPNGVSRLLALGDTVNGFRVVRITADSVTITRQDTTLTLRLSNPGGTGGRS